MQVGLELRASVTSDSGAIGGTTGIEAVRDFPSAGDAIVVGVGRGGERAEFRPPTDVRLANRRCLCRRPLAHFAAEAVLLPALFVAGPGPISATRVGSCG